MQNDAIVSPENANSGHGENVANAAYNYDKMKNDKFPDIYPADEEDDNEIRERSDTTDTTTDTIPSPSGTEPAYKSTAEQNDSLAGIANAQNAYKPQLRKNISISERQKNAKPSLKSQFVGGRKTKKNNKKGGKVMNKNKKTKRNFISKTYKNKQRIQNKQNRTLKRNRT